MVKRAIADKEGNTGGGREQQEEQSNHHTLKMGSITFLFFENNKSKYYAFSMKYLFHKF